VAAVTMTALMPVSIELCLKQHISVPSSATQPRGHGLGSTLPTVLTTPSKGRERLPWRLHRPWHSCFEEMPRMDEEFKAGDILHAAFLVA